MADEKADLPRVLILGGVGFIGRNLVKHIVDNKLASYVKVSDKSHYMTSSLHPDHVAAFKSPIVKFQQADLSKDAGVKKAFDEPAFDYVINLCGETRFGLNEQEYEVRSLTTAQKCSQAAKAMGVKKWVEVSTAHVYNPNKSPSDEDSKLDPWTRQAKYRLQAEQEVRKSGVPAVVLRPAYVYGPGDLTSLTPRITCAATYQVTGKKMEFLWGSKLLLNTVHVEDVVTAIWMCATKVPAGKLYNLADSAKLDQGALNKILGDIFKIKTGFHGTLFSKAAALALDTAASVANDMHVPTFTTLCQKHNILNTPISAYIDKELLRNNHLSVDGSRITKEVGFKYKHQINEDEIRAQIDFFIKQGIFPPVVEK